MNWIAKGKLTVTALVVLVVTSCGGGGGGSTSFTSEQLATMRTVGAQAATMYKQLLATSDNATAAAQVVAWAQTQYHVSRAFSEGGGEVVGIEYDTGVLDAIIDSPGRPGGTKAATSRRVHKTRDTSQFPNAPKAAIFAYPLGSSNDDFQDALTTAGYTVDRYEGTTTTPFDVESLKKLKQYSVVYIDSHGTYIPEAGGSCIMTAQAVDDTHDQSYKDLLTKRWLIHLYDPGDPTQSHPLYAFSPPYVSSLTRTSGDNSFVYADSCKSMNGTELASAFGSGTAFIGWRGSISLANDADADTALIDCLTTRRTLIHSVDIPSNAIPSGQGPESPLNLKHSLDVMKALQHGIYGQGVELQIASGNDWGLMPHLDTILWSNTQQPSLLGSFGIDAGSIVVGTQEFALPASDWSDGSISTRTLVRENLPPNDTLYIRARGLKSNTFRYFATEGETHNSPDGTRTVYFLVVDPNHKLSKVTITGPGCESGLSVPYDTFDEQWVSEFPVTAALTTPSTVLDYTVIYSVSDGSVTPPPCKFRATGYSTDFVTLQSPVGTVTGPAPSAVTFSWTSAAKPGTKYFVGLYGPGGQGTHSRIWETSTTSPSATYPGQLQSNVPYVWLVEAQDPDTGNSTEQFGNFTYRP